MTQSHRQAVRVGLAGGAAMQSLVQQALPVELGLRRGREVSRTMR